MPCYDRAYTVHRNGVEDMKKKLMAGVVIAICLSFATYSTLAYFTHEDTATNVITSGNIEIELQETAIDGDGQIIPFEESQEVFDVMPAETVSKIVKVENTGDNAAYIRISVEKFITLAEGNEGTPDNELIIPDFNTEEWTEVDGYYYYNYPLEPGETTTALFNSVTFDPSMDNMYQSSKATIIVDAEATQVKNNGADVFTAAGWPEK